MYSDKGIIILFVEDGQEPFILKLQVISKICRNQHTYTIQNVVEVKQEYALLLNFCQNRVLCTFHDIVDYFKQNNLKQPRLNKVDATQYTFTKMTKYTTAKFFQYV